MSHISANQQRLISQIVLTSHTYAFCYFSVLAAASSVICYCSGNVIQPLIDVALIMTAFVVFRLGASTVSKLKAYRFEQGKTVGSILNETMLEISAALSVKPPLLYIFPHEDRNALCTLTAGFRWIVLLSEALEKADAPERRSVLSHELGHLKCLHALWIFIGISLIVMLIMSTYVLCEVKGLELYAKALITNATMAIGVLSMARFARQHEFQADAIATVLNGKEGLINNLLERYIPMLAAIGHDIRPELSRESLAQHFSNSPNRLELVLAMVADDRNAIGFFAKLDALQNALLDPHPPLVQRVKNMERFETLATA